MKLCPICGTAVMVKKNMLLGQVDHGVWVIAGANSVDALADMCEDPRTECYCPNESCGDAHVYADDGRLHELTTIPYNPLGGMVTIDQLKDYYYSVIDPKYPANRPREDEHFLEWVSKRIGHQPWQGTMMECIDE